MKKDKSLYYVIALSLLLSCSGGKVSQNYPYRDRTIPVETRVEDLLSRMTTDEKISQLDMYWGKEVANLEKHGNDKYNYSGFGKWIVRI